MSQFADLASLHFPPEVLEATRSPIITCTIEGILEPEDLAALAGGLGGSGLEGQAEVDDPANLKKIREKHHSVARLIASGMSQRLVAMTTGYTESYLSILLNNPAMQELIELYRTKAGAAAEVIGEKLRNTAMKAVDQIAARLDDPEKAGKLNTFELAAVAKLGLDRSGHGPSSKHHVVTENHVIDHAELQRLNQQARAGSRERIVNVEEVRKALLPPTSGPTPEAVEDAVVEPAPDENS